MHMNKYLMDQTLYCVYCNKECKNRNSLVQHEIRCRLNPNRNVQDNLKNYRNKLKNKEISIWNKDLTKETDERILKGSITFSINEKNGLHINHPKHISEEHKNKIKASNFGGYTGKHSIEYKGIKLDSSYEYKVAISLDNNNIKWIRPKKKTFKYYEYNDTSNKYHYYTPDFYLLDYNIYLDPKNDFLINNINPATGYKDTEKIKWVEQYNNICVIILNKDELDWCIIKNKIENITNKSVNN